MKFDQMDELLHGADYNAEQWLDRPEILKEDIRLMKEAAVNVVTLGVFSWASLEPEEGVYTFKWLDEIMDAMYANGIYVILATPSGGKPPWLVKKYPEVMRMNENRVRLLYGERENQCNSSRIYRQKVRELDEALAKRYAHHPALIMWHISNEMYGICHCLECQKNFQKWLLKKYGSIDKLNEQYWSRFWSHTYTDFSELESPSPHGETAVHALALDYQRFYSDLSIDFIRMEISCVRKYNPNIPVTTNLFHLNCGINYQKLEKELDIVSWDSYPRWHCGKNRESEWEHALEAAFRFDFGRSLKKRSFVLMESTVGTTNNFEVSKLKRPGMHLLSSMQAVACGSDTVQYFQWRQSRGAFEKFHSAVVSHNGSEDTRIFRDTKEVGGVLKQLGELKNASTVSEVALIYDWENMRALEEHKYLRKGDKGADQIVREHYEALIRNYVSVDIIGQDADFSPYKIIAAPMLYLFLPGTTERICSYIEQGGTFVMTFYSGLVNENDLAFECFSPYQLNDVFGVRCEEIDCLLDDEKNQFSYEGKRYEASWYCELIHADQAEVLAEYEQDFYQGYPALTKHTYGNGTAYYMACRGEKEFLFDFYQKTMDREGIKRIISVPYVKDVMVKERVKGDKKYVFLMNFAADTRCIDGEELERYGVKIRVEEREKL